MAYFREYSTREFITAFGGFGALSSLYGYSVPVSSLTGFASGLFFGAIIYYFARFLYSQQATTQVRSHHR